MEVPSHHDWRPHVPAGHLGLVRLPQQPCRSPFPLTGGESSSHSQSAPVATKLNRTETVQEGAVCGNIEGPSLVALLPSSLHPYVREQPELRPEEPPCYGDRHRRSRI